MDNGAATEWEIDMKLEAGMAAVVTGAASGLGEATARMLAVHGVKVALFDTNAERGEQVAAEIGGLFCACDVTSDSSVESSLAKARAAHGPERITVNCAGIAPGKRIVAKKRDTGELVAHDMASFEKVVAVNLFGTFRMMARSAVAMAALAPVNDDGSRGVIINTASVAAEDGQIGQAAYAASKGGVAALTLPAARDLASSGIRVATILPGLFETPMFASIADELGRLLAELARTDATEPYELTSILERTYTQLVDGRARGRLGASMADALYRGLTAREPELAGRNLAHN